MITDHELRKLRQLRVAGKSQEFRFRIFGMTELITTLFDFLVGVENAIERPDRSQIDVTVEQRMKSRVG